MKTMKYPLVMELAKSAVEALLAQDDFDPDLIPDTASLIEELHEDGYYDVADRDELLNILEERHGRKS